MERAKNYCSNLTKTTKNNQIQKVTKSRFVNSKEFRNTVHSSLTNESFLRNDNITNYNKNQR